MIELVKIVILGIVEGITEFLPISSTGHLIVAVALLKPDISIEGTFELFIQFGAVVAVVVYYWRDLLQQAKTVRTHPAIQRLWLSVIIGAIPASVVGLLVRDYVKATLFNPVTVAIALMVGGVFLIVVERKSFALSALTGERSRAPQPDQQPFQTVSYVPDVTVWQGLLVGVAQVFALIPGVSRAAASIVGGMFVGLDRETATRFSFYLAIPTLGGATLLDLLLSLDELQGSDLPYLIVGALVSGVVAWFAIDWLLHYVAAHNFVQFGIYRVIAGIAILILAALALL